MNTSATIAVWIAVCPFLATPAVALFFSGWNGETTVTVEKAPIRKEQSWGSEPIIYVVKHGDKLMVSGMHGNGTWLTVEVIGSEPVVRGSIDRRETSF